MAIKNTEETKKTVSIMIPRVPGNNKPVFVGHNGRIWLIPRGVRWEVPEGVAEILNISEAAEDDAYEFQQAQMAQKDVIQGAP